MVRDNYEVYRGLQKPLEFMGLQGRYILWAAITGISSFILFGIFFSIFGFVWAISAMLLALGTGVSAIALKQRKGLHSKSVFRGVKIVTSIFK